MLVNRVRPVGLSLIAVIGLMVVSAVKPPSSTNVGGGGADRTDPTRDFNAPTSNSRSNNTRFNTKLWKKDDFFSHSYSVKDVQLGCKELRSKRYISDGFCTSIKPITEVVCSGICLPVSELPWYSEVVEEWSKRSTTEWRCVNDVVRRKRVHLICRNGERRSYRIRTVRSCKCKKFVKNQG